MQSYDINRNFIRIQKGYLAYHLFIDKKVTKFRLPLFHKVNLREPIKNSINFLQTVHQTYSFYDIIEYEYRVLYKNVCQASKKH